MSELKEDRVRVLRVLEYEGPRSWVEKASSQGLPWNGTWKTGCYRPYGPKQDKGSIGEIRSAVVGQWPQKAEEHRLSHELNQLVATLETIYLRYGASMDNDDQREIKHRLYSWGRLPEEKTNS
jgi:hypothetical protein